jgi:large subunit ribosomal protein L30
MAKEIKITQIKSSIGYRERTKNTLIALGLRKMNTSVIKSDNAAIRGMIAYVSHLVKIEEI